MNLADQSSRIGALADPMRRALYEYVATQREPVGREEAARALDLATHKVKFHLDKLVDEGLLQTEFRRLSGRSGPGAGRPNKLYRRADTEFSVSLPERRYDLVGHILANAVDRARRDGIELNLALADAARNEGRRVAEESTGSQAPAGESDFTRVARVLAGQGFEPRIEEEAVVLSNCPFDALAKDHTELVCTLNHAFVQSVADELGSAATACLEPSPGQCCVLLRKSG
ncbi:MAG TPA: helix-turn-helix domain-containing protein [Nocardioides sp.]